MPESLIHRLQGALDDPHLVLSPQVTLANTTVTVLTMLGISADAATFVKKDWTGHGETHTVVVSVVDDQVGWTRIAASQEREWTYADVMTHEDRIGEVRLCVDSSALNLVPMRGVLATHRSSPAIRAAQQITVRAWWQALLAEGHTPETARLMLSLTVPPHLLRDITYPADGTPTLGTYAMV